MPTLLEVLPRPEASRPRDNNKPCQMQNHEPFPQSSEQQAVSSDNQNRSIKSAQSKQTSTQVQPFQATKSPRTSSWYQPGSNNPYHCAARGNVHSEFSSQHSCADTNRKPCVSLPQNEALGTHAERVTLVATHAALGLPQHPIACWHQTSYLASSDVAQRTPGQQH